MFGTKIRSWMEAQLARSRAKRKERKSEQQFYQQQQQQYTTFESTAFFGQTTDFNEVSFLYILFFIFILYRSFCSVVRG